MNKLQILLNRLTAIGIDLELIGNFPWVYLHKVNGKRVVETGNGAEHGWCIGFEPIFQNKEFKFTDLTKTFKLIRKYSELS